MPATPSADRPSLKLWWAVLILGCAVSVVLNLWHALTLTSEAAAKAAKAAGEASAATAHPVLGIIFALVPALFAAMLSHGLISPMAAKWFRGAILSLFGVSMLTSMASQAAVMRPYGGGYGAEWAIPLVLDASSLLALHYITMAATTVREAAARAELEADLDAVRAELGAELAAARAELEAEAKRNSKAELAAAEAEVRAELRAELEAELDAIRTEAEAEIRRRAEAETEARVRRVVVESEARIRREVAEEIKPKTRQKAIEAPAKKSANDGLTSKDKARILLTQNPGMTGAELGRALGKTDRYGRQLLEEIQKEQVGASTGDGRLRAVN
ncbi:hypothetical protein [Nonomuraea sp. NPDC046570]|uniref:hypothetical protein n=1 Tax=Nonomuraea sp. NPDC046570 TaxID=3155255 RepID=UPI0033CF0D61